MELAMGVDNLALVLRALGIGLAIESLVNPDTVRRDLYGDFVELLVSLQREHDSTKRSSHTRARR
jgi:hypothetical protein